jgi:hypothetical protein
VLAVHAPRVPTLEVAASDRSAATETLLDVNLVAGEQLHAMMPLIVARAVLRRAVKATTTTAGATAVKSSNRNSTGDAAELGFALLNLLWTSAERADTRSWSSLPAQIQVARLPLSKGVHRVRLGATEVEVRIGAGRDSYALLIEPDPGGPGAVLVDRLSVVTNEGPEALPEIE